MQIEGDYYSRPAFPAPTLAPTGSGQVGVKPQSPDAGPDRIGAGRGRDSLTGRAKVVVGPMVSVGR